MFLRHPILSLVTVDYLALIGWITLAPQSTLQQDSLIYRLTELLDRFPGTDWLTFDRIEFLANVAMFLPIGLFFVLLLGRSRWWFAIVLGVAMTVAIEYGQQFISDRVSDPRDVVANSLGAVLGSFLALALTAAKARRSRAGSRLAAGRPV